MKFTQGEWKFDKTTDEIFVKVEGKGSICEVFGETEAEAIANAELIAEAPKLKKRNDELVEALRKIKKIGSFDSTGTIGQAINKALKNNSK